MSAPEVAITELGELASGDIAITEAGELAVSEAGLPASPEVGARLVANHRQFLAFLERRTGDRVLAEELLQAAFVRGLERGGALRDDESAVAWFFRLLRNALVDHHRRGQREARALQREAAEGEPTVDPELQALVCACVGTLVETLKPEYAELLRRVDLAETPLGQAAVELGLSPGNASVRLHRARQALKRQLERSCGTCATHGCLDCRCGAGAH